MVSLTLLCYCSLVKPVMGVTHSGLGYIVSPVCYLWLWEEKLLFESFILHSIVWNYMHLFPQIYNVLPCVVTETLQSRVVWNIPFSFCCLHGGDTVLLIKMPRTDLCVRYVILLVTCQEMFWDRLCLKYFITAGGHITLQFCSEICTVSEVDLPMEIWCQTFFSSVLRLLSEIIVHPQPHFSKGEYAAIVCFLHTQRHPETF